MAYVITDACASAKDTACIAECPVDCIAPRRTDPRFDRAPQLYINPADCITCGLCVDACPVRAIFAEDDLPPDKRRFIQLNADWFRKPQ